MAPLSHKTIYLIVVVLAVSVYSQIKIKLRDRFTCLLGTILIVYFVLRELEHRKGASLSTYKHLKTKFSSVLVIQNQRSKVNQSLFMNKTMRPAFFRKLTSNRPVRHSKFSALQAYCTTNELSGQLSSKLAQVISLLIYLTIPKEVVKC